MGLKNMNIKDRIISYEPIFDKWVLDEIIDVYDQESIVRIKDQSYGSNQFAYLKVITIYDQDDDLKTFPLLLFRNLRLLSILPALHILLL